MLTFRADICGIRDEWLYAAPLAARAALIYNVARKEAKTSSSRLSLRGSEGMAKSGYKGINRIDQPSKHTHGWYVRVSFDGKRRAKFFPDRAPGGRANALEDAIAYRNKAEAELGKPRTDRTVCARTPRNKSGIMGIRRKTVSEKRADGANAIRSFYEVTWNPRPGKVSRTLVSIDDLGEGPALRKACSIRRAKEREMFGATIKANWTGSLGKLLAS